VREKQGNLEEAFHYYKQAAEMFERVGKMQPLPEL
jgi:hypothetical protein